MEKQKQTAKLVVYVTSAVAALATATTAHFKDERVAKETARASAAAVIALREDFQARAQDAERAATAALRSCKAEADSVRTLVLGWLIAHRGRGQSQRETADNLQRVVKQLGQAKAAALKPLIRPKSRPMPQQANAPIRTLERLGKSDK